MPDTDAWLIWPGSVRFERIHTEALASADLHDTFTRWSEHSLVRGVDPTED